MVKLISWFNTHDKDLHVVTLDSDVFDGTNSETAYVLDFRFNKIDPVTENDEKAAFNGQATDTGGGRKVIVYVQKC